MARWGFGCIMHSLHQPVRCPSCGSPLGSAAGRCSLWRVFRADRCRRGYSRRRYAHWFDGRSKRDNRTRIRLPHATCGASTRGRTAVRRAGLRSALPHHPGPRRRRHGRRLSGVGRGARRGGGAEGHPTRSHARHRIGARGRAPVQARARAGPPGHPQARGPDPRPRRARRYQVPHDAVCRRGKPRRPAAAAGEAAGGAGARRLRSRSPAGWRRRTRSASFTAI